MAAFAVGAALAGGSAVAVAEELVLLPDGEPGTLQAALDAVVGADPPTVLVVPPGDWSWGDGRVETAGLRDVVLIGAGAGNTRLYRDGVCPGGPLLLVERSSDVRIAELALDGCDELSELSADGWTRPAGLHLVDVVRLRVDHCAVRDFGWVGVRTNGDPGGGSRGVIDHCDFARMFIPEMDGRYHLGYGVAVSGVGEAEGVPFGAVNATVIEDSTFDRCRHAVAAGGAGRYVFRHNVVTANRNSHAVDAHGLEGAATAGTEWVEVYDNLIHQPDEPTAAVRIRGGRGLVWNNEIRDYTYAVSLWEETAQPTGPVHIWGNTLGAGVTRLGDVRGGPAYDFARPGGYEPLEYPHPLVADLEVRAGPDQNVSVPAGGLAPTYLDATQSSAAAGSTIVGYRWYDGATLVSTCARDVVGLATGTHVVVLAVERDDGMIDVDTALVRAVADGPVASSTTWRNRWFVPLVGRGTIELDATPSRAPMDGYVGFSGRRVVDTHEDHAMLVRFNTDGRIDAYDDARGGYRADAAVSYRAGTAVHLALEVDVDARRYDVRVDGVLLAAGCSFRADVLTVGQLTVWHASGGVTVEGLRVAGELAGPDPACAGGADGDADADADADLDAGTDAGTDVGEDRGSEAEAGTDADAAPLDTPGESGPDGEPAAGAGGGCGCAAVGAPGGSCSLVLGLALAAALVRRRRPG